MILPLFLCCNQKSKVSAKWVNKFADMYKQQLVSIQPYSSSTIKPKQSVIIAVHGFGSSPFECRELKKYIEQHSTALVSNVYLGKHQSLDEFSNSSWQDWLQPICDEYQKCIKLGYEHIILVGCSTGATLILQGLKGNCFLPSQALKHIVLIDSFIDLQSKYLDYIDWLAPLIFSPKVNLSCKEANHWLPIRPKKALLELNKLKNITKKDLKKGLVFSSHINVSIFKSKHDPIMLQHNSKLIYEGLTKKTPCNVTITTIDSCLHVFSRLKGRKNIAKNDKDNQIILFDYLLKVI